VVRLLALYIAAVIAVLAAPEDYQGRPVRAIEFRPENQPYSREYLYEILPVKAGQPLDLSQVRAAIERLFATGRYADIAVDAQSVSGGVILTFITSNNYFVGHVSVQRVSEPPNEGVLVNSTRLELGSLFTQQDLTQAETNLRGVLRDNGFYESQIHPVLTRDSGTQQVAIHFETASGDRAHYRMPVVTGHPGRSAEEIEDSTHWKGWFGWKKVTEARTQDGLRRVRKWYQKQDRLEARVALEDMRYNPDDRKVTPVLAIQNGPKIRIVVAGAKVSGGKLRQLVPVYQEQSVDRDLLVEGSQNLVEYFQSEGYFDAKVDFSTQAGANGQETIRYAVDRGERYKLVAVVIEGNKYFDTDTIRERMYVRPASLLQYRHGRYSQRLLRQDVDAIRALYRSNGFRDVNVTSSVVRGYRGKATHLAVFIRVEEGPQWLVHKLDLEGVSPQNREDVENLLQSIAGQPFSELNVAIDRDNVLSRYYNSGYPNASFEWSFTQAREPHQMDLKYVIHEGERRYVRKVLVSGLQTTDPGLVAARVDLEPGDPLSREDMTATQRRLYDLGIFARVDLALQNPQGDERDKYILLDVDEARKYTITAGLGAEIAKIGGCQTCLDAPAGQAGFSPRALLGITRRNFLGYGHIVSVQTRVSTLEQRAVLNYQAPQFRGNSDFSLLFSALYDDSRDVRTFTARRREGSVQLGQKLSKASTMLYRFSFRRVSIDQNTLKITPELIPFYAQPARIGMVSGNLIQDRRDDPVDTHRGIYNTVDFGWASHVFGSQSDFTRLLVRNATYYPFGLGSRFVLARSITFGWEQTLPSTPPGVPLPISMDVPLPERFFAGGAQSHRGFPENQAGPRDPETGFPIGGKALLVNQVELRFPLIGDNIRGVLFEDAGNVYTGLNKLSLRVVQRGLQDFNYMVHAVGFGVRYRTPVGPIRVDFAYSINPPRFFGFKGTSEQLLQGTGQKTVQQINHFQFHFSLGQVF
jgi:outer membrane protein insertion porin family